MQSQVGSSGSAGAKVPQKTTKIIAGASIAIVVLIGLVWLVASLMLKSALKELNASGQKVTADQVRALSLKENATALASIAQGDLLLYLPTPKIKDTIVASLNLANASLKLPITTSETELTTADQTITFSSRIDGKDPKSGIELKGRLHGVVGMSFVANDFILRPAAERIELDEIHIPGWNWFPSQIVRLANPIIARIIGDLNGAIQVAPIAALPKPSVPLKVKLGSKEIEIPGITPLPPAILVDASGVQALVQLTVPAAKEPAATELAAFQQAFKDKVRQRFPEVEKLPPGLNVADAFLKTILGPLSEPGELEAVAATTVASNAKVLNEMSGPDIVLRVSAAESQRLITASMAKTVADLKGEDFVISDVKHSFDNGVIGLNGKITSNIKFGKGGNVNCVWAIALAAVASTDSAEKVLFLSPKVAAVRLVSVSVSGDTPDFTILVPTINGWLEALRTNLNKVLPKVPVSLPAVVPRNIDLKPMEVLGGQVAFNPPKILTPAVSVSRALIAVTPNGLWILADIETPGLAARAQLANLNLFEAGTTPTFNSLDAAVAKVVQLKYGDLPRAPLVGFASWNRFAAVFNATWDKMAPRVDGNFDTGVVKMIDQKINLLDYARFSCDTSRNCPLDHCETPSCRQDNCGKDTCRGSCGDLDLVCRGRKAACEVAAEGKEKLCIAAAVLKKGTCDVAAGTTRAACDGKANAKQVACNLEAETRIGACELKRGITNGAAEVSGVGKIGGEARVHGELTMDVRRVVLNEERPGVSFTPVIDGKITGKIDLDWIPYDVLGHVFVCPTRGRVPAQTSLSFSRSQPAVVATIEAAPVVPPAENAPPVVATGQDLIIKVNPFRIPFTMQPGLLNALYTQNPHIVVTCPVAGGLLGVAGLVVGNSFRAISEGNIMASLAVAAAAPGAVGPLFLANENDNVRAGMGTLFGGTFFIPVSAMEHKVHIDEMKMDLPGGSFKLKPTLSGNAFKFEVTEVPGSIKTAKQ